MRPLVYEVFSNGVLAVLQEQVGCSWSAVEPTDGATRFTDIVARPLVPINPADVSSGTGMATASGRVGPSSWLSGILLETSETDITAA